jgi:hypothetical protein
VREWKLLGTIACIGLGVLLAKLRISFPDLIVPFGIVAGIALYIGSGVFLGDVGVASRCGIWLVLILASAMIAVTNWVFFQSPSRGDFALLMFLAGLVPFLLDIAVLIRTSQTRSRENVDD